jgi:hypothetical protein
MTDKKGVLPFKITSIVEPRLFFIFIFFFLFFKAE